MHKIRANINYGSLNKGDSNCNLFGLLAIKPEGRRRRKTSKCCCAGTEGQMRQKSQKKKKGYESGNKDNSSQ